MDADVMMAIMTWKHLAHLQSSLREERRVPDVMMAIMTWKALGAAPVSPGAKIASWPVAALRMICSVVPS